MKECVRGKNKTCMLIGWDILTRPGLAYEHVSFLLLIFLRILSFLDFVKSPEYELQLWFLERIYVLSIHHHLIPDQTFF